MAYRKYHNRKVKCGGRVFDSLKEYRRYCMLKLLQQGGIISDLRLQVPFELIPAIYEDEVVQLKTKTKIKKRCVQRATNYIADFVYVKNGRTIVEDVKGSSKMLTKEFELKRKLMRYVHGIEIYIFE